jgi:hypothetical protein
MTTPTRPGIPTTYADTNFRSRLEARWAAFFDLVGWKWTYEPIDADGYIPDFLIHGERPFFVEVGPCVVVGDYREKAAKPDQSVATLGLDLLIVGVDVIAGVGRDERAPGFLPAGLLGEFFGFVEDELPDVFFWAAGLWTRCTECGHHGVIHPIASYAVRGCGHHLSGGLGEPIDYEWLTALWRRAGNDVQWRGPRSVAEILRSVG